MKLFAITLVALTAATFSGIVTADDAVTRSPELQVLARYVGQWEETVVQKPAAWTPEGLTYKVTGKRKWFVALFSPESRRQACSSRPMSSLQRTDQERRVLSALVVAVERTHTHIEQRHRGQQL